MAKCIQLVGQGVPVRMTDDEAFQIVDREKDGQYCSKNLWREWYAPSKTFPEGREPARTAAQIASAVTAKVSNWITS